jgi:hypothetical protein
LEASNADKTAVGGELMESAQLPLYQPDPNLREPQSREEIRDGRNITLQGPVLARKSSKDRWKRWGHPRGFSKFDYFGDTRTAWRLDRLGRSVTDLLTTLQELEHPGVGFVSLTEATGSDPRYGRAMAGLLAVFAAF